MGEGAEAARLALEPAGEGAVRVRAAGAWTVRGIEVLARGRLPGPPAGARVILDGSAVAALDTAGAWLLWRVAGGEAELAGWRPGFAALLELVRRHIGLGPAPEARRPGPLAALGARVVRQAHEAWSLVAFVGAVALDLARALARPRHLRPGLALQELQAAGVSALPIVGLLAFLMGIVIAYQGGVQLRSYGANIFVADLVGLSVLREIAPLITAILLAGRSGSAYTAQIGTMRVTEEIDALRTLGLSPLEILVVPKLLGLVLALPLLTVYADALGVAGGMLMAQWVLEVSPAAFVERLHQAVDLSDYLVGVGKAPVFAALIALVGCHRGFLAGASADSVGRQTTLSVVQAIFLIIVTDALFSVVFSWLGL